MDESLTKRESEKIHNKLEELKCLFVSGQKTIDECAQEWTEFTLEMVANGFKEPNKKLNLIGDKYGKY